MTHSLDLYIELYKRKAYEHIPLGAYADGTLYYPTAKQVQTLELLDDDITTNIGYGGSARSGKSIIECTAIIFDCLTYPGIAWGLARKELTTLKRTVLITLFRQFEFYGIGKNDHNYNQQLNRIDFNNGSTIFLIDTAYKPSDPLNTRFGGFELTRCAIDESNETIKDVVIKLFERTGWRKNDTYGLRRKLFECFNPAKNHVYNRFYVPYRDKKEPDFKRFIAALPADNPHPSVKEWIDDIVNTGDKVTIERQVHGNFDYDDDPATLCNYQSIEAMFTNSFVSEQKGCGTYITADIALHGSDQFVIFVWYGFTVIDFRAIDKCGAKEVEDLLRNLAMRYHVPQYRIAYDADGLGSFITSYIAGATPINNGAKPIKSPSENDRNHFQKERFNHLKSQLYFKLAGLINANKIFIECDLGTHAQTLKEELAVIKNHSHGKDGALSVLPKDKVKELLGRSPDFSDALAYRMFFALKTELSTGVDIRYYSNS